MLASNHAPTRAGQHCSLTAVDQAEGVFLLEEAAHQADPMLWLVIGAPCDPPYSDCITWRTYVGWVPSAGYTPICSTGDPLRTVANRRVFDVLDRHPEIGVELSNRPFIGSEDHPHDSRPWDLCGVVGVMYTERFDGARLLNSPPPGGNGSSQSVGRLLWRSHHSSPDAQWTSFRQWPDELQDMHHYFTRSAAMWATFRASPEATAFTTSILGRDDLYLLGLARGEQHLLLEQLDSEVCPHAGSSDAAHGHPMGCECRQHRLQVVETGIAELLDRLT